MEGDKDRQGGSAPLVEVLVAGERLLRTRRCRRTDASVATLPLASVAERQYRQPDERTGRWRLTNTSILVAALRTRSQAPSGEPLPVLGAQ